LSNNNVEAPVTCSPDGAERNPGTIVGLLCRSRISLRFIRATKKENKEAERRQTHCRQSRTSGCGRATERSACADPSAVGRARLPAFHHGSCQGEYLIPKARPGPGFVDTASTGRASRRRRRTHFQRCTPRSGRNAGRHDARTARGQIATPPAGTDLAPTPGYACRTRPLGRGLILWFVTEMVTYVNRPVTVIPGPRQSAEPGIHNPCAGSMDSGLAVSRQSGMTSVNARLK